MDEKHMIDEEMEELENLHDNELDDIVLEKYEKRDKIKRYLLIAGSLLLIFVIVVTIVKIVTDSSSAPQDNLIEEKNIAAAQSSESQEEFQEVPIVAQPNEEKESEKTQKEFDKVVHEVLKKEKNLQLQQSTTPQAQPTKKRIKSQPKKSERKIVAVKQQKKRAQKKIKKVTKKPTKVALASGFGIQVGAFSKTPDKVFLKKIKNAGFSYIVRTVTINGKRIKRIYVGPFPSRNEALVALRSVRKKINKNAFVTRIR